MYTINYAIWNGGSFGPDNDSFGEVGSPQQEGTNFFEGESDSTM